MRRGTSGGPKATRVAKRAAVVSSPTLSKDELRSRIETLERANANLRATNRTLKRAADEAAERITELERYVSRLERKGAPQANASKPGRRRDDRQKQPDRDPGDAVPPGVAVQSPEPLSHEDERVLEHLNEELGPQ
jgi:chromosome segregation ATPase